MPRVCAPSSTWRRGTSPTRLRCPSATRLRCPGATRLRCPGHSRRPHPSRRARPGAAEIRRRPRPRPSGVPAPGGVQADALHDSGPGADRPGLTPASAHVGHPEVRSDGRQAHVLYPSNGPPRPLRRGRGGVTGQPAYRRRHGRYGACSHASAERPPPRASPGLGETALPAPGRPARKHAPLAGIRWRTRARACAATA